MELLKFINQHENWKELLQEAPYFLNIKEDDGYTLLKYNQIKSDFSEPIVKECRGIILDSNNKIVCHAFDKFFNFGETYADEIDWNSARVQEKIDGSIMKLWYDKKWRLSTNGTIDAYTVDLKLNKMLQTAVKIKSLGKLFESAENYKDLNFNILDKNCTYIFELISPYQKIVIAYPKTLLYHIGTRNNLTQEELDVDIGIQKPKEFQINSIEHCIEAAAELKANKEGYVVRGQKLISGSYARIKVKNPIYLQLHRMISNNELQLKDILGMLLENEQEEFLVYFPEYQKAFDDIIAILNDWKAKVENTHANIVQILGEGYSKKDYALKVMELDQENFDYYFQYEKGMDFEAWIRRMTRDKLVEKIKKYSEEKLVEN